MKDSLVIILLLISMIAFYYLRTGDRADSSPTDMLIIKGDEAMLPQSTPNMSKETGSLKPNRSLPSSLAASKSLLVNGDFEANLQGWDYKSGIYWSDNGGQGGSAALLINAPEIIRDSNVIYSKAASQCVNITGTSIYAVEASFRYLDRLPIRPSVNRVHMYWYDGLDCAYGGQYAGYLEPSLELNRWQRMTNRKLVPALGARSWKIKLEQRQDGNNNAEAIWDDIVFVELKSSARTTISETGSKELTLGVGENYLKNPGFDDDRIHWKPERSKRLQWRPSSSLASGGVMAATLPNDRDSGIGTGSFDQCVNFGVESRFEFGAKVKIDPSSTIKGGGRLRPTWYEGLNCKGRYRGSNSHADVDKMSADWQSLQVKDLSPAKGSKSVKISVIHSIEGRGEHTMLWDDFYFRAY